MSIQRALAVCVAVIAASVSASFASPCSQDIDRIQAMIDAKLEAQAAAGRSARESTAATLHRQPTPGSIAAAEVNLGRDKVQKVAALWHRGGTPGERASAVDHLFAIAGRLGWDLPTLLRECAVESPADWTFEPTASPFCGFAST